MKQRYSHRSRRRLAWMLLGILGLAGGLSGCGKKEEAVVFVEEAPKEETQLIDEGEWMDENGRSAADISSGEEALPGTVLGEETFFLYQGEEGQQMVLQRVQGSFEYSLAYDAKVFVFSADKEGDMILSEEYAASSLEEETEPAVFCMTICENMDYALEELADQIVLICEQECLVEDTWIGEEEYPAVWITYTEERNGTSCQIDYYLAGFEDRVFQIQMICPEEELETWGEQQQLILSTLRFQSKAEG